TMTDNANSQTSKVANAASETADKASEMAKKGAGAVRSNPLGLAIGAAAAGFLVGVALPSSRVEDQRLGAVSDQVKGAATEVGQEAFERGKTVAQDAKEAALEAAKERGKEELEGLSSTAQEEVGRLTP
ncbi:MAG: hypothetical protein QOE25_94, partial [Actinomycetota bacterium]|nr:hypothetical protein [Actinomycetota bacterium]